MKLTDYLINESIEDKGILKAVFMGGTPGSGKSYVLKKLTSGQIEPRIVNTDTWSEFLKVGAEWNKYIEDTTKRLTKAQLGNYINSMLPLWIDGTSAKASNLFQREGILKSVGYDTGMIWVSTSLETAKKRAKEREKRINRVVPDDYIEHVYKQSQALKKYYKSHFNPFVEIKNDEGELNDKVVLEAFRKMTGFFKSPIRNPIGMELYDMMRKDGHKYLMDTDKWNKGHINKLLAQWYEN